MSLDGVKLTYVESTDDLRDFLSWLSEDRNRPVIGVDTETTGLDPYGPGQAVRLIQIGDAEAGWAFDWQRWAGVALRAMEEWRGGYVLHHCFSGDTEFITRDGVARLDEKVGEVVEVWDGDTWAKAEIQYFGKQPLRRIELLPKGRRTNYREVVYATPDHRWELLDGYVTHDLRVGDAIPMTAPSMDEDSEAARTGFVHGLIYADGSLTSSPRTSNGSWRHQIRLCGRKVEHLERFEDRIPGQGYSSVTFPPSSNGSPWVYLVHPTNFKELPDPFDPVYVREFIRGWADMDGTSNSTSNSRQLSTVREHDVEWLKRNAAIGGYVVTGVSETPLTNEWAASSIAYSVTLWDTGAPHVEMTSRRFDAWTVSSITLMEGEHDVYCAVVPGKERFTLKNGVYTSNCSFDIRWIEHHSDFRFDRTRVHDTMIMSQVINPLGPHGLKPLSIKHVDRRATAGEVVLKEAMARNKWDWATVPLDVPAYSCVPLDTEILTRRGWLPHDQVVAGSDETLGLNLSTGVLEWTGISVVNTYPDAPLVQLSHLLGGGTWSTECTADHKWVVRSPRVTGAPPNRVRETALSLEAASDLSSMHPAAQIVRSAPAQDGASSMTETDVRVLTWLMESGSVTWSESGDVEASIHVLGSRAVGVASSLAETLAPTVVQQSSDVGGTGLVSFTVDPGFVKRLWNKAGLHTSSLIETVLSLPHRNRVLMIGVWQEITGRRSVPTPSMTPFHNDATAGGDMAQQWVDALLLLGFLCDGHYDPQLPHLGRFGGKSAHYMDVRALVDSAGETAPVWCPTTGLGTWVARDRSGNIFITGNSYAALDPVLTVRLYDALSPRVADGTKLARVYDLEMRTQDIISRMEDRGMRIDREYAERKAVELAEYADRVKQWGKERYGVLLSSPKQLTKLLTEMGGEITQVSKTTGAPSADKYQLQLFQQHENEHIRELSTAVLAMRKAAKFATSYFEAVVSAAHDTPDGWIVHPSIRVMGARTGRMSVSTPPLQQIPKGDATVRDIFIPREGNVLISSDFDQIEMRLSAHFSEDQGLIDAFAEADAGGGDFFTLMGRNIYREPDFRKSDKRRGLVKNCVPLSSQILTKRGWLSYDEVKEGDETLGWDVDSGMTRWTEVTGVHVFDDPEDPTPVYRMKNGQREFYCTDDHRWPVERRRQKGHRGPRYWERGMAHASEIPGTEMRMVLAAPAEDGWLDVSPDEAAVLGWVLSDGVLQRAVMTGAASQAGGRRRGVTMQITQTKPDMVVKINELLSRAGAPHALGVDGRTGQHFWSIKPDYARDLLARAGIDGGKDELDPWPLALGLTAEAREAMADAIRWADGNTESHGIRITEATGSPVSELCTALWYLLGYYVKTHVEEPSGKGWQKNPVDRIFPQKRYTTGQRMTMEHVSDESVWCVSTGLGTWTMRQDCQIPVLTGNTMYGKLYGAGPAKMAESAGVPLEQMTEVANSVDATYPGLKRMAERIIEQGRMREQSEGVAYVETPLGRRLPADEDRTYSLTNYLHQATAAEVFKQGLVALDNAGYGPHMALPVHDEILLDIPEEDAEQALHDVPRIIGNTTDYRVPLTAGADGPYARWGMKYL